MNFFKIFILFAIASATLQQQYVNRFGNTIKIMNRNRDRVVNQEASAIQQIYEYELNQAQTLEDKYRVMKQFSSLARTSPNNPRARRSFARRHYLSNMQ
ncbi:Oidioi.mRNA.OKI2018_I69.chr1.g3628.t1.cds [Oikopleura dioica]|uniref:Oidioi.mRNA.OKI2018_I69.chr1.g3628.t1.cds n=1 Tax=Oikopleura dioica TaxID=34765 RepID=A0ABN7T094_OIKDI|nr:Oidioi.mRNA.OKI2018_I69.chr1.g3628.t1.cds [Oikopleura dioica]